MGACERTAAQARVIRQSYFFRDLADAAESAILQGADIELPSRSFVLGPSKKDVARGLHHALPFDDTASLRSSKGIFGSELLKDRVLRFLYLKEERLAIAAQEQADAAESADRPDERILADTDTLLVFGSTRPRRLPLRLGLKMHL